MEADYRSILVEKTETLRTRVRRGEFRCAYGFLSALHRQLDRDPVGLLLKRGLGRPVQIRYHIDDLGGTLRQDNTRALDDSIENQLRRAEDADSESWHDRWFTAKWVIIPPRDPEAYRRAVATRQFQLPKQRSDFLQHVKWAAKHEAGVPVLICRVWPVSGWSLPPGTSAWVYAINPGSSFLPVQFSQENLVAADAFCDLLTLWFTNKASVLHNRRAVRRALQNQATLDGEIRPANEDDFHRMSERFAGIYKRTIVWPISAIEFSHFLEDFVPPGNRDVVKEENWRCFWKRLHEIAEQICDTKEGTNTPGCANCPGRNGCPQHQHDNRCVEALTSLHLWHPSATPHLLGTGKDGKNEPLLHPALEGLEQAKQLLDGMEGHSLDFSLEAAKARREKEKEPQSHTRREAHEQRRYERKLLRFWLARAIAESQKKLGDKWRNHPIQRRLLEYPAALGRLATVLLSDQPWTAERIENLIQALAGYAHQVLGIPESLEIHMHLNETLRGETALHTLKQRYRDHFFHTIEVCLIGHWLLLSQPDPKKKQTLAEYLVQTCSQARDRELKAISAKVKRKKADPSAIDEEKQKWHVPKNTTDFLANWWLAALSHDTAYGIDVLGGTLKLLEYFSNHPAVEEFKKGVEACVKKLGDELRPIAPELTKDSGLKKDPIDNGDHGMITAGHLQKSFERLDKSRGKGEAALCDLYDPAARAVAFHNSRQPAVAAERDPVAALLILCDTVQDWGRSQLGFSRSPAEVLSRIVEGSGTPSEEQFGPVEAFYFSMSEALSPGKPKLVTMHGGKHYVPRIHVWKKSKKIEIRLHYASWMTKKPDCRDKVLFAWADVTYNLQRVDFSGWSLGELTLVQRTPYAQDWKRTLPGLAGEDQEATELERFSAMIRDQGAWSFLENWLKAAGDRSSSSPLSHELLKRDARPECKWEEVTIRLIPLGEEFKAGRRLMGKDAGEFGRTVGAWSKRITPLPEEQPAQRPPK